MKFMTAEYSISTLEIERRKKALFILVISLCFGFILASIKPLIDDFWNTIISISVFALVFFLLALFSLTSFKSFSKSTISLTDQYLERKTHKSSERYAFSDFRGVKIKRTINGHIREVKVSLVNGKSLSINALNDFEPFKERLMAAIEGNVKGKEYKEPIDYDHKLFYVFFGLLVGFSVPLIISLFIDVNDNVIKNLSFVIALYVFLVGGYIILEKPISKSYGGNAKSADYLLGSIIICLGIYIFISSILK